MTRSFWNHSSDRLPDLRLLPRMSTDLAQQACDRYEIADTKHRYAFGLDHGDADSLASAFTEDCVLDFTSAGRKLGIDFG